LSRRGVFVAQVNELWEEILPTTKKKLRLEQNKTLGRRGIKWATGRGARDCARGFPFMY
jgi:hypothetical protein